MPDLCLFCFDAQAPQQRLPRPFPRPTGLPEDLDAFIVRSLPEPHIVPICLACQPLLLDASLNNLTLLERIRANRRNMGATEDREAEWTAIELFHALWWNFRGIPEEEIWSAPQRMLIDLLRRYPAPRNCSNQIGSRDLALGVEVDLATTLGAMQILQIRSKKPGKGHGSIAMKALTRLADEHDAILSLKPPGTNHKRVERWLQRFAFTAVTDEEQTLRLVRYPARMQIQRQVLGGTLPSDGSVHS